jgi:hypothetical protein
VWAALTSLLGQKRPSWERPVSPRKADVEIGSRGSEKDVTDVVRFLRERCPKLDVGGEAIDEILRSGPPRFALAMGSGGQRGHQVRYVQPRAVLDESAASTRSRSIDLPVGAFAALFRKIGSR